MINRKKYKSFFENKLLHLGGAMLLSIVLIATIGPWVIVDQTTFANDQVPQLALLPAMSKIDFIQIDDKRIPVKEIKRMGNGIEVEKIISGDLSTSIEFYRIDHETIEQSSTLYLLGTDNMGRDVLSRVVKGIHISIFVGLMAMIISVITGTLIGLVAGYFGGWLDHVLMMLINSIWSIPTLLLVFAMVLVLGKGVENIFIAVGLTMWVEVARLVRSLVKKVKEENYIEAAKALSFKHVRILKRHVLPNIVALLLVMATANFATAILVEAGLSYLGFGVQPPQPSLGIILSENYGYALSGYYAMSITPAIIIILLVLSMNLIGNALRDIWDVKNV